MTISAQRLQELESQLSGLEQVKPKNQKERKKLEQERETLTCAVASLKAYLALEVGGRVTDGTQFGVIISKTLSLEGMLQAWVSWYDHVPIPEQPIRLKPEPFFKHFKVGDSITNTLKLHKKALKLRNFAVMAGF